MILSIVVATSSNGAIGQDNRLPWHLPEDLQYFKALTMGKPIIMGRKTYESIGRPLPGRTNVVITRNSAWQADGVVTAHSLEEGIRVAEQASSDTGGAEVMVIGGSDIYRQALNLADKLYVTEVAIEIDGDAFFPEIDPGQWQEIKRVSGVKGAALDHYFVNYQRCR